MRMRHHANQPPVPGNWHDLPLAEQVEQSRLHYPTIHGSLETSLADALLGCGSGADGFSSSGRRSCQPPEFMLDPAIDGDWQTRRRQAEMDQLDEMARRMGYGPQWIAEKAPRVEESIAFLMRPGLSRLPQCYADGLIRDLHRTGDLHPDTVQAYQSAFAAVADYDFRMITGPNASARDLLDGHIRPLVAAGDIKREQRHAQQCFQVQDYLVEHAGLTPVAQPAWVTDDQALAARVRELNIPLTVVGEGDLMDTRLPRLESRGKVTRGEWFHAPELTEHWQPHGGMTSAGYIEQLFPFAVACFPGDRFLSPPQVAAAAAEAARAERLMAHLLGDKPLS